MLTDSFNVLNIVLVLLTDSNIDTVSFDEGSVTSIVLSANDIDGDELIYSILGGDNIIASIVGDTIDFSVIDDDWNGIESFTVTVSDGEYTDSQNILVTVNPVNDAPILDSISDQTMLEGGNLIIILSASDIDNNSLTYTALENDNVILQINGPVLTLSPLENFNGQESITIIVSDGELSDQVTFLLIVQPVNDPPVLSNINNITFNEDELYSIDLIASDVDGDDLYFEVVGGTSISTSINDATLTFTPLLNFNGSEAFTIFVYDDSGLSDYQTIIVTVDPVNDAPIANTSTAETNEDESIIIILSGNDIDGDDIEFSLDLDAINGSVIINGTLATYIPNENYNGNDSFTFSVSDGIESSSAIVNLNIIAVNDSPTILSIAPQESNEDEAFIYSIDASDVDGDELIYFITSQPDNATVWFSSELPNQINVLPDNNWNGDLNIQFSVSDNLVTVYGEFNLTVLPVNDPPVASEILQVINEEQIIDINLQGYDEEDYSIELTYSINQEPSQGTYSLNQSLLTYQPNENFFGLDSLSYIVTDSGSLQDSSWVYFTINNIDDIPELPSISDDNINEDTFYEIQLPLYDLDNTYLEYSFSAQENSDNVEFIFNEQGLLRIEPLENWNGQLSIIIFTTDGITTIQEEFILIVNSINDTPEITSFPVNSALVNEIYEYYVVIDDPDDEVFLYELINEPIDMNIDSNGLITWMPTSTGVYDNITVRVYDSFNEFSEQIFTIDVKIQQLFELHGGNNLVSFVGLNENDNSIENIFSNLNQNLTHIFTENYAAVLLDNGTWFGSLNNIEPERGYWLRVDQSDQFDLTTYETPSDLEYSLHYGNNLISYVGEDNASISDALPDEVEEYFTDIITENLSATRDENGNWIGSLASIGLQHLKGYWMNVSENITFSYSNLDVISKSYNNRYPFFVKSDIPKEFDYMQSQNQAFYFIKELNLKDDFISDEDWIIAYHDDVIVGARKWFGEYSDVPAMGDDGFYETAGYCIENSSVSFKLFNASSSELIDLVGDIPKWNNSNNYIVSELYQKGLFPEEYKINNPYPNPFNPIVNLDFEIPNNTFVDVVIYDIAGRVVQTLSSKQFYSAGYHTISWNAENFSSGIYFIRFSSEHIEKTKKITLLK